MTAYKKGSDRRETAQQGKKKEKEKMETQKEVHRYSRKLVDFCRSILDIYGVIS